MIGVQTECGAPPPVMPTPKMPNSQTTSHHQSASGTMVSNSSIANSSTSHSNHQIVNPHHHQQQQLPPRQATARERAIHAVEYYNSNVLRVRVGFGLTARSSVNERHLLNGRSGYQAAGVYRVHAQHGDNLYRSNSSLELVHNDHHNGNAAVAASNAIGKIGLNNQRELPVAAMPGLRREYGSHGSIDALASSEHTPNKGHNGREPTTGESFFRLLQEYQPATLDVGTKASGSSQIMEHSSKSTSITTSTSSSTTSQQNFINESLNEENGVDRGGSPKLRTKLQRLWGPSKQTRAMSMAAQANTSTTSGSGHVDDCSVVSSLSADIEERQRRRAFAHYDCQSLAANLGYAAKLRGLLLARRRNTTTGASAASMLNARASTPDSTNDSSEDYGDGQGNDLLENCPFFRNEVGGEEEREVSLTRFQTNINQKRAIHRPALACGVSILESDLSEMLWKDSTCPFQRGQRPIESVDCGARYYRKYFHGREHQNWFGLDEQLGPVAISIKREKLPENVSPMDLTNPSKEPPHQIRMIVRTSELLTLRGSVIEESIPNQRGTGKAATTKDILEYVAPEIQMSCLRLGVNTPACEQQLLKLDEQGLTNKYKVGILYCRAGQHTEEDMYNNEEAGPAFLEFLDTIGKTVRLQGFEHYKAGLDNKTDSTGTHSLYAVYQDCEVMFHVSTMLPVTPNNRQQLLRKRHIGNDIVTIVFQEPGSLPFTPKNIRSQFQHVFVIVRAINPCTDHTQYKVSVSRSKEVPVFGPPIRGNGIYSKGKSFTEFLLSKVINAENAAHRSEKFATMATRTRQEYLKDLSNNYCTTTLVETGTKFSIFGASKKKERPRPRFNGSKVQRGAFCWQVVLNDGGQLIDAFLGISNDTFVLIEECSRQIVFVTPCKSILGWSTSGSCIRIYHHQSECITLGLRETAERDEQLEVIERLRAVTPGCGAIELSLRRNHVGQLGFHVQPDGVVTQVEQMGQAWTAGLRQGYRLVEICKVAVATLSHDEMVDLLKTSTQVTVLVIESHADHSPRRGCYNAQCKFNIVNYEIEYDLDEPTKKSASSSKYKPNSAVTSTHHRRYERNFSPPRSSNSSGYGTGSSSRSFSIPNADHHTNAMRFIGNGNGNGVDHMGTLTSSSSGHSSNDDRWYDILEVADDQECQPARHPKAATYASHPKLTHTSSFPLIGNNSHRPLTVHDPHLASSLAKVNEHRVIQRSPHGEHPNKGIANGYDCINTSLDGNQTDASSIEPIYNLSHKSTDDELVGVGMNNNNSNHHHNVEVAAQLKRSATTNSVHKMKSSKYSTALPST